MTLVSDADDRGNGSAMKLVPAPGRGTPVSKASGGAGKRGGSAVAAKPPVAPVKKAAIPTEADFIISALEAGSFAGSNRRKSDRWSYRVSAALKLYSDGAQAPPWTLYVRDVGTGGLGFVTRHRLPLGYGGILTIATPQGKTLKVDCTLLRCREAIQGWFEGSMYFNRQQVAFDKAFMQDE